MPQDNGSTRRAFLKRGALLATPIAAAAALGAEPVPDGLNARVQRLEDEAAIRELHQSWVREVNADGRDRLFDRAVRRIIADHAGAADQIKIAGDGCSAVGYFDHAVEVEIPLPQACTLVQMALAQGTGALRRTERRTLTVDYRKTRGMWKIVKVAATRS